MMPAIEVEADRRRTRSAPPRLTHQRHSGRIRVFSIVKRSWCLNYNITQHSRIYQNSDSKRPFARYELRRMCGGKVRSRPFGSSGDGGNDRDRCLSREGERRLRSYPVYLNTSITIPDRSSAHGSGQLCRAVAVCFLLVRFCNAQQQKFGAPLPRATNNTAVGFKSNF